MNQSTSRNAYKEDWRAAFEHATKKELFYGRCERAGNIAAVAGIAGIVAGSVIGLPVIALAGFTLTVGGGLVSLAGGTTAGETRANRGLLSGLIELQDKNNQRAAARMLREQQARKHTSARAAPSFSAAVKKALDMPMGSIPTIRLQRKPAQKP